MPTYIRRDMWEVYDEVDLFCITTNSYLKNDNTAVMGRGIAKQAADKFPGLPAALGSQMNHLGLYGLRFHMICGDIIGFFQVKKHWRDNAELDIIKYSTEKLLLYTSIHPDKTVALNFPGIGYGRLNPFDLYPILSVLPNTVSIYEY